MTTFGGLPHRLERAGTIEGVRFINDSKATNANAAAQALAVYPRVYWIAGGVAKDGGIDELAPFFPRIAKAYLIGQSAGDFSDTLRGKVPVAMAGNLEAAVKLAFRREGVGRAASGCAALASVRVVRSVQELRRSRRSVQEIRRGAERRTRRKRNGGAA
jgi:UDP-N-acetylmuramoylalanine--D-glutamate ligase